MGVSQPDPSHYPGQPGGSDPWQATASPDTPSSGYQTPPTGYGMPPGGYGGSGGGYGTPPGGYAASPGGYQAPYSPAAPTYGTPPPPPPPVNEPETTNGFAIASLICGIVAPCGAGLLAVVFGIVALVQMRQRRQKGKGMAIAGLVLTGAWLLVFAAIIVISIIASGADRDPRTGDITSGGNIAVSSLRPGDCVNGLETGQIGLTVPAVPCSEPHEAEVYSVFDVTQGGAWPGEDPVIQEAEDRCLRELEDNFPDEYADNQVDIFYLHPSEATWRAGDREVICLTYYLDGRRTGSIFD